jgi:hypothetical protein
MPTTRTRSLLLTLADVAALARVQRPVVSMWRSRSRDSDLPFPAPTVRTGKQELFDADAVTEWLVATGRGNNPHVGEETALFAAVEPTGAADESAAFDGLTSLLALKAATGERLSDHDAVAILDLADDADPHDRTLYREIAALGEDLTSWAERADAVASAAYTPAAAFEALLARRVRHGLREHSDTAFDPAITELVARIAATLAEPELASAMTFVDPSGGSDLLVALRVRLGDLDHPSAAIVGPETGAARLARRRAVAHGWWLVDATADDDGRLTLPGTTLVLAQYPSPAKPTMTDDDVLAAIDDIALAMDDDDRAVIVGPAGALADATRSTSVDSARDALLRTDRVRAIVRLPAGLWTARPRQQLAVWVLGPAHKDVAIGDRWITVADLGAAALDDAATEDLVTDIVAAMGNRDAVRGHAFRFAQLARAGAVLASSGDLVGGSRPRARRSQQDPAETAVRVAQLIQEANRAESPARIQLEVEHRAPGQSRVVTLGELAAAGTVRVIPGNRLDPADVTSSADVPVIAADEVVGTRRVGERTIDRLTFSTRYPSGRYTEPGDLVFCSSPAGVGAIVDVTGFSVVMAPARVLRLNRAKQPGLVPDAVARALIQASPAGGWRTWPVPLVPTDQASALERALAEIFTARANAERRLASLDALASTLTDGVTSGALTLTLNSPTPTDDVPKEQRG